MACPGVEGKRTEEETKGKCEADERGLSAYSHFHTSILPRELSGRKQPEAVETRWSVTPSRFHLAQDIHGRGGFTMIFRCTICRLVAGFEDVFGQRRINKFWILLAQQLMIDNHRTDS